MMTMQQGLVIAKQNALKVLVDGFGVVPVLLIGVQRLEAGTDGIVESDTEFTVGWSVGVRQQHGIVGLTAIIRLEQRLVEVVGDMAQDGLASTS